MFVLGLNSSPRKNGNSEYLLSLFMKEAEKRGCETEIVYAAKKSYEPCIGCGYCEKKGFCSIKDTLADDLFTLFRKADLIVLASPVYFYGIPARMKAIIDRSQTLWSRKYRFGLHDPKASYRKALLLTVGATKGSTLFDGIKLTGKYFLDALGAELVESLCYTGIDDRGVLKERAEIDAEGIKRDIEKSAANLLDQAVKRKKIIFACRENAGRSQMAAAFARDTAGERYDVFSGGSEPATSINPTVVEVMAEKGIDLAFHTPSSIDDAVRSAGGSPDIMVTMGCSENCPFVPGCRVIDWNLTDPSGKPIEEVRKIRDEIMKLVNEL